MPANLMIFLKSESPFDQAFFLVQHALVINYLF